jgi:hypothetical protein
MTSKSLQEFIQKIFGDEQTKLQFVSDPEGFLSRSGLTEQEKKAVLDTQCQMGLATGDSAQLEAAIRPTSAWYEPEP